MTVEIISCSISTKYGARSGSNSQPLDLQSDLLPTALGNPVHILKMEAIIIEQ